MQFACPMTAPSHLGGTDLGDRLFSPEPLLLAVKRNEPWVEKRSLLLNVNLKPPQEESRDEELPGNSA